MDGQPMENRLHFLKLGNEDRDALHQLRDAIAGNTVGFVDAFYERLLEFAPTRALVSDPQRLARLRQSQRTYVDELLSGPFDEGYAQQRRAIGKVHQKVGLEAHLYIESAAFLLDALLREAFAHLGRDQQNLMQTASALVKVMMLDIGLAIDSYVEADRAALRASMEKLRENEAQLSRLALVDHLTGLPNRAHFYLDIEGLRASEPDTSFSLLFIDLDQFKEVNDTQGHGIGDRILVEIGRRLSQTLLDARLVARLGGDEFVVVASPADRPAAMALAHRAQVALAVPVDINGDRFRISASIGVACYPEDGDSVETLVRNADIAMYEAKRRLSKVEAYTRALGRQLQRQVTLAERLVQAIDGGAIDVYFQPQVALEDGRLVGMEALARWHDPVLGTVRPDEFIGIAEEKDLIMALGNHVLERSLDQLRRWTAMGLPRSVRLAVNLSPRQLGTPRFTQSLVQMVRNAGVDPRQLDLELTESGMMREPERAAAQLDRLRREGFGISVDDFGSGYSSLSHLRNLPITQVKLDRCFIGNMLADSGDMAIVRAALSMARSFGIDLVAEGVETTEHVLALRDLGCQTAQGYFFDPALDADGFAARWIDAFAMPMAPPLTSQRTRAPGQDYAPA